MDVHCSTCGEPWDVYHLRHDAIFETGLEHTEAKAWVGLPARQRLSHRYREKFKAVGWEFGASVLDVTRCPCCPKGAKPDLAKAEMKSALVDLLGDDEDGVAAMMEDYGL